MSDELGLAAMFGGLMGAGMRTVEAIVMKVIPKQNVFSSDDHRMLQIVHDHSLMNAEILKELKEIAKENVQINTRLEAVLRTLAKDFE